jgi:hypothetical protein
MKRLALALLAVLALTAQTYTGVSVGTVSGGVVARFDCSSYSQSAQEGGSITLKYGDPIQCVASRSTVSGAPVNDAGYVPEVWFDWNWNDSSLGTKSVGGRTIDLDRSIGLVASHAYLPSTFADTCGGGTNTLKTLTLTVYAVVSGARSSGSATLAVCVENPATTWPNPVAYCNDANCADDDFSSVVQPGTPTHGGNGTALETILQACGSGSKRILVEGGLTWSTASTGITVGSNRCLVQSYGGSNAKWQFTAGTTAAAISANTTCGGYTIIGVTFAGNGAGPRAVGPSTTNGGCLTIINSQTSGVGGEEFDSFEQHGTSGKKFSFFNLNIPSGSILGGATHLAFFSYGTNFTYLGGDIASSGEHHIRFPSMQIATIDGVNFTNQATTKNFISWRHDCNSSPTCTGPSYSGTGTISRSSFYGIASGGQFITFNDDGSGALTEATKAYDVDLLDNIFAKTTSTSVPRDPIGSVVGDCDCGEEMKRFRYFRNATDSFSFDSGSARLVAFGATGGTQVDQMSFIGNVMSGPGDANTVTMFSQGGAGWTSLVHYNNVCWENGAGSCDLFTAVSEDATDKNLTGTDPWDRDGVSPGTLASFDWPDVLITSSNATIKGVGVVAPYPTDIEGESVPQSSDYDSGVDDE